MLNLKLPFQLARNKSAHFFRRDRRALERAESTEVVLEGLSISIKTGAGIYEVSSLRSLQTAAGPSAGTAWTRWLWQFNDGFTVEQQLAIPVGGDALAISWRLIGRPLFPCHFEVSPIFSATEPFAETGFQFDPETNGGRLTWQPLPDSSKIIADTNGRFDPIGPFSGGSVVPAAFEFTLSPQPAVLILSSELPRRIGTDPLIGGFLARLSAAPLLTTQSSHCGRLAAA
jgi:hypothetical protein